MIEVYPVVHINDTAIAIKQGELALGLGADGIYLIDHNGETEPIFETMAQIRANCPDSFIGINLLGYSTDAVYRMVGRVSSGNRLLLPSAVWVDNVEQNREDPVSFLKQKNGLPGLNSVRLLGGIAFKYTGTFTEDPECAAAEVKRLREAVDVITTSGAGTGKAPTIEKLRAVKQAAGNKPVAVASGISAQNIREFVGLVDQILVSSSIETYPYSGIFDEAKLKELIDIVHAAGNNQSQDH